MSRAVFWYVFYVIAGLIVYRVITGSFEPFSGWFYALAGLFVVIAWKLQEQRNSR